MLGKYVSLSFLRVWKGHNFITSISSPPLTSSFGNQHHTNGVRTHTLLYGGHLEHEVICLEGWGDVQAQRYPSAIIL